MRVLRRTVFVWKRVLAFVGCWDMERGGEALAITKVIIF